MNIEELKARYAEDCKQWSPEWKRLKSGEEFIFYGYYPEQQRPIHVACKKDNGCFYPMEFLLSDFEEIPVPYAHIKIDEPVYVFNKNTEEWIKRHFAEADIDDRKAIVYIEGKTSWTTDLKSRWDECLTIEEYKSRFGDGNDNN